MDKDVLEKAEKMIAYLRATPRWGDDCGTCTEWGCEGCDLRDRLDAAELLEAQERELAALQAENTELRSALARAEAKRDALEGQLYAEAKRWGY